MFAGYTYLHNKKNPESSPDDYEAILINGIKKS
jgi:hypothetical protein